MQKQKLKKILTVLSLLILVMPFTGCTLGGASTAVTAYKPETLVWWGVWDNEDDVAPLIKEYKLAHPNVTIEYRKFRFEEYETELINALAENRGPDIFAVHNTWVKKYLNKISPAPVTVDVPVQYVTGSVKKDTITEFQTTKMWRPSDIKKLFVDTVASDVVMVDPNEEDTTERKEKVWGWPISMDTLVLYYNKDLVNNAGIAEPPKSWDELKNNSMKIAKIEAETGNILVAGAAIGTANNVVRNFDILSLLMMQNLAPMTNEYGEASFDQIPQGLGAEIPPGQGALEYYAQYSAPLYEAYTWNDKMPNSLEAFINGKVGYFFGYAYNLAEIKARNPKLNFAVAPVPQVGVDQKVNYANYWVNVVSKQSKLNNYAWSFNQFMAGESKVVNYLDKAKKPTALRSAKIINKQLEDEELAVFADQVLTAKSWYHGYNSTGAEQAFNEMINLVVSGSLDPRKALEQGVSKVNYTIYKR